MAKVVLITGGGRGIGAAAAKLAAKRGYDVAISYQSNDAAAASVVKAVEAEGRRCFAFKGNVAREADILAMFAAVDKALGPVWGLVNNAGITGKIGRVEDVTAATVQEVIDVNVVGALLCAREAIKRMSTKRGGAGGVIVNLSSVAVSIGSPNTYVWYAAAKGAVDSMTLGLGLEVAREGIRVVGVAPGLTETEIHAAGGAPDRARTLGQTTPMGRHGTPDEIAEAIVWMMSDAASYVTAATLRVGGGR